MWQSVAQTVATFLDTGFSLERQKHLTLGVLIAIAIIGLTLLAVIAWSDLFYV